MSVPQPFDLVPLPEPVRLNVPGRVVLRDNIFALVDAIAEDVLEVALHSSAQRGTFHLGVSLTPVTEQVFRRLLMDNSMHALPWDRTHVWLTDDAPGPGSAEPPSEGFREFLADHAGVPPDQVHMPLAHLKDEAASHYADRLNAVLQREGRIHGFDFAAVTLGSSGVVGVQPPQQVCGAPAHRIQAAEATWTAVHPSIFHQSRRVAIVSPDVPALGFVKSLKREWGTATEVPTGWGHVRPESPDRLTWYVNIESGDTDGRPEHNRRRPGKDRSPS